MESRSTAGSGASGRSAEKGHESRECRYRDGRECRRRGLGEGWESPACPACPACQAWHAGGSWSRGTSRSACRARCETCRWWIADGGVEVQIRRHREPWLPVTTRPRVGRHGRNAVAAVRRCRRSSSLKTGEHRRVLGRIQLAADSRCPARRSLAGLGHSKVGVWSEDLVVAELEVR